MLTPGAENLQTIIEDLHAREQRTYPNRGERGHDRPVKYLGLGREVAYKDGDTAGIYAYGCVDTSGKTTHVLQFEFLAAATGDIRQKLGSFRLSLNREGLTPNSHGFKTVESMQKLITPLGAWATQVAVEEWIRDDEARTGRKGLPTTVYVDPSVEDLAPLHEFIDDSENEIAHHSFASGIQGGLRLVRIAQDSAPRQ